MLSKKNLRLADVAPVIVVNAIFRTYFVLPTSMTVLTQIILSMSTFCWVVLSLSLAPVRQGFGYIKYDWGIAGKVVRVAGRGVDEENLAVRADSVT